MTTRVFPGIPESASAARRFVTEALESMGCGNTDAATVTSELVTNSVRHSLSGRGGWIGVSVTAQPGDHAVIIVSDDGPADGKTPVIPACRPSAGESGMGLWIVSRMAELTLGADGLCWARLPWAAPAVPESDAAESVLASLQDFPALASSGSGAVS